MIKKNFKCPCFNLNRIKQEATARFAQQNPAKIGRNMHYSMFPSSYIANQRPSVAIY